jgi:hypothetical protein
MVARVELLASVAQPVAPLARLDPTASTAMVELVAMAEMLANRVMAATVEMVI